MKTELIIETTNGIISNRDKFFRVVTAFNLKPSVFSLKEEITYKPERKEIAIAFDAENSYPKTFVSGRVIKTKFKTKSGNA